MNSTNVSVILSASLMQAFQYLSRFMNKQISFAENHIKRINNDPLHQTDNVYENNNTV